MATQAEVSKALREQRYLDERAQEDRRWDRVHSDAVQIFCALLSSHIQEHHRLMRQAVSEALELEQFVVDARAEEAECMARLRVYAERAEGSG